MACGKFLQGQFSIKEVEALAMEVGILLARDMKLSQIIVESDAIRSEEHTSELQSPC